MAAEIEAYARRLAAAGGERAGPTQAKMLAGELRAAHGRARTVRDSAAAALHYHHGWTFTQLCTVIHGRPNKVAAVREAVEKAARTRRTSAARAEEALLLAQHDVRELWALYKRAKALEAAATDDGAGPDVILDLPSEPRALISTAAAQLRDVSCQHADIVQRRNRAAAALTVHAGWSKRQAAGLAGAAVRDLYPQERTAVRGEAEPHLVAGLAEEARQLDAWRAALIQARDGAIRELSATVGPAELARLAQVSDERVVQIRDGKADPE
ncbi:hypothetical protein O7605_29800 [Verrucosispora sp. WMMA2121]|uniref:hypothetical protein n=1 Tax=Verrucosispora sp. WMMA2121 TaxID=3015164 RepID=UPI0022B6D0C7|nr:hypothetical protein [Verrucosispora sp. WMMA2121]MCZ7423709.1 hypothetical protein [Verrucosispora sp. WMMA2121]